MGADVSNADAWGFVRRTHIFPSTGALLIRSWVAGRLVQSVGRIVMSEHIVFRPADTHSCATEGSPWWIRPEEPKGTVWQCGECGNYWLATDDTFHNWKWISERRALKLIARVVSNA